ncbi:hypothetical protein E2C01_047158 [Portunus trituberculatus]|uniref:Uncharacterized protein n=1 Tax=Portunus trituberculatus TaxID=210409 RepID=A0A5B7G6P7_PORTR|nr:hypothetical protein [Portunus trituberculatus]
MAGQEESQSTPELIHIPESSGLAYMGGVSSEAGAVGGVVTSVPENTLQESCTRLSTSLEENGLYKCSELNFKISLYKILDLLMLVAPVNALVCVCTVPQGNGQDSSSGSSHSALRMTLDELRQVNRYAESTKSLSYLPQVSRETSQHTQETVSVQIFSQVLHTRASTYSPTTHYHLPLFVFVAWSQYWHDKHFSCSFA